MKQKPVAPEPSPPTGLNTGERAVNQYTLDVSFVRTWPSMTAAPGVVYSSIRAACNGRIKNCRGYVFRYADDPPPDGPVQRWKRS